MSVEQITDGRPDGATIGRSADKVSLYGVTPVVQAANIEDEAVSVTTTKFNQVLTALENVGITAAS